MSVDEKLALLSKLATTPSAGPVFASLGVRRPDGSSAPAPKKTNVPPKKKWYGKGKGRKTQERQAWFLRNIKNKTLPGGRNSTLVLIDANDGGKEDGPVKEKSNKTRSSFVKGIRVRYAEDGLTNMWDHGNVMPVRSQKADIDYHMDTFSERVCVAGSLPATSDFFMLWIPAGTEYTIPKNSRWHPKINVKRGTRVTFEPKPVSGRQLVRLLDISVLKAREVLRHYGLPDDLDKAIPLWILAQWQRKLLSMLPTPMGPLEVPDAMREKNGLVAERWNMDKAVNPGNKPDMEVPAVVQQSLGIIANLSKNLKIGEENSENLRKKERVFGAHGDRSTVSVNVPVVDEKTGEIRSEIQERESGHLYAFKNILMYYPYLCIIHGQCNAEYGEFSADASGSSAMAASKALNHQSKFMTKEQRASSMKGKRMKAMAGGAQKASRLVSDKFAMIEYLDPLSLYLMADCVLNHPEYLCIESKLITMLRGKHNSRKKWKEMKPEDMMRVNSVHNNCTIDSAAMDGISLYHTVRDHRSGWRQNHTYMPLEVLEAETKMVKNSSGLENGLEYTKRENILVLDEDPLVTEFLEEEWNTLVNARRSNPALSKPLDHATSARRLYLASTMKWEKELCEMITRLDTIAKRNTGWFRFSPYAIIATQLGAEFSDRFQLDDNQRNAIEGIITKRGVQCLRGPPGAGKSLVISICCYLGDQYRENIVVCAPSAAAALSVENKVSDKPFLLGGAITCATIESVIVDTTPEFAKLRRDCKYLIVDETSMVCTSLMARLLKALPHLEGALFVGDPDQLGPVEWGDPYSAFVKVLPTHSLERMFRASGEAAKILNYNAKLVRDTPLIAMSKAKYAQCDSGFNLLQAHRYVKDIMEPDEVDLLTTYDKEQHKAVAKAAQVFIDRPDTDFNTTDGQTKSIGQIMDYLCTIHHVEQREFMFIASYHDTAFMVNAHVQRLFRDMTEEEVQMQHRALMAYLQFRGSYASEYEFVDPSTQSGGAIPVRFNMSFLPLFVGDLVFFRENHKHKQRLCGAPKKGRGASQISRAVRNGDEFTLAAIVDVTPQSGKDRSRYSSTAYCKIPTYADVRAGDRHGWFRQVRHTFKDPVDDNSVRFLYFTDGTYVCLNEFDKDEIRLGYCRTIHSFQGRERKFIIYLIVPKDLAKNAMADRRIFYVGVTRAKHQLIIVGKPKEAQAIINRAPLRVYDAFEARLRAYLYRRDNPETDTEIRIKEHEDMVQRELAAAAELMQAGVFDADPMTTATPAPKKEEPGPSGMSEEEKQRELQMATELMEAGVFDDDPMADKKRTGECAPPQDARPAKKQRASHPGYIDYNPGGADEEFKRWHDRALKEATAEPDDAMFPPWCRDQ